MATNQPTNAPVNQFHLFEIVATEIADIFNPLIEQLIAKRDALLTKLQTMKKVFITKETTRRAVVEELERVIRQMKKDSIKLNVNLETQEEAIQVYRGRIERHQTPTNLPSPFFSYHQFTPIHETLVGAKRISEQVEFTSLLESRGGKSKL